ncbi:MAG: hypothetical protein ACJAVI_005468 [Candidatus Azotimanducaceae bacterium]|jgi:hypothetical protein
MPKAIAPYKVSLSGNRYNCNKPRMRAQNLVLLFCVLDRLIEEFTTMLLNLINQKPLMPG